MSSGSRRLFITGGIGFTGQHLLRSALEAGYEVADYTGQLEEPARLKDEIAAFAPTAVVHLAAISAVTHADEGDFYRVNVLGTQNLLRACAALARKPARILVASSANIYGNAPRSPIGEDTPPSPQNHYAISKLASEHVCAMFREQLDINVVRPFNYTGVGHDLRFVVPKIVDAFRCRLPRLELGNLDVEREFNDVRFVMQAYLGLLDRAESGVTYNICTGKPYALRQVLEVAQSLTGHAPEIVQNPAFMRANDIDRLYGDPGRLNRTVPGLPVYSLEQTLGWMLEA